MVDGPAESRKVPPSIAVHGHIADRMILAERGPPCDARVRLGIGEPPGVPNRLRPWTRTEPSCRAARDAGRPDDLATHGHPWRCRTRVPAALLAWAQFEGPPGRRGRSLPAAAPGDRLHRPRRVPGDISAASQPLALAAIGGRVRVDNLAGAEFQPDMKVLDTRCRRMHAMWTPAQTAL